MSKTTPVPSFYTCLHLSWCQVNAYPSSSIVCLQVRPISLLVRQPVYRLVNRQTTQLTDTLNGSQYYFYSSEENSTTFPLKWVKFDHFHMSSISPTKMQHYPAVCLGGYGCAHTHRICTHVIVYSPRYFSLHLGLT